MVENLIYKKADFQQFKQKGIPVENIEKQIKIISEGIEPAEITDIASIENGGIKKFSSEQLSYFASFYDNEKDKRKIVKFVPASGAASRMFKALFEFINSDEQSLPIEIKQLFENIKEMALFKDLKKTIQKDNMYIDDLLNTFYWKKA